MIPSFNIPRKGRIAAYLIDYGISEAIAIAAIVMFTAGIHPSVWFYAGAVGWHLVSGQLSGIARGNVPTADEVVVPARVVAKLPSEIQTALGVVARAIPAVPVPVPTTTTTIITSPAPVAASNPSSSTTEAPATGGA